MRKTDRRALVRVRRLPREEIIEKSRTEFEVDLWIESNTWCPHLTAAMILSGSAVQVTGLGSWFISATKRLMVAWRSTTHRKTSRFSRRLASLAKNPSTALSHEQEVGVKDGNPSQDSNVRFLQ
jgi:hypothetical protein